MEENNPLKIVEVNFGNVGDVLEGKEFVAEDAHPLNQDIPRQYIPGWIRWPVRLLVFPFMILDQLVQGVLKKIIRAPYKIVGNCKQRGHCCYYILLCWPRYLKWVPWLGYLYTWWLTEINGFFFRDINFEDGSGERYRVMSCRYLRRDGKCGHHILRPTICRQYPWNGYFRRPRFIKGCGFKIEKRE